MRPLVHASSLLVLAALAIAGCGAASARGSVCGGAITCADGSCVAGRCRAASETPATTPVDCVSWAPGGEACKLSVRVLLAPVDMAVLASRGDRQRSPSPEAPRATSPDASPRGVVPEVIALGRADTGSLVVLLRFVASWRDDADVVSAFLTMDPLESAPPARASTPIEIARVLEPWSSETATWGRQPRLGLAEVAGIVPGHPVQRLRVDVTAIVRGWPRRAADEHGIALLAHGDDPYGSVFTTGVSAGAGPRLEVYVR